jgi:hypothetical protein
LTLAFCLGMCKIGGQDVVISDYPALVETLTQLRITTYDQNIHIFYA